MAAACGTLTKIDRMVIDLLIKWFLLQPKSNQRLCINLSMDSLLDEDFIDWLIERLSVKQNLYSKFIIEFSERPSLRPDGDVLRTVNKLNDAGIEVGLDHVGEQLVELDYLEWFPASYVKIHQSIISKINDEQHHYQEMLIQSLAKVADSKNFLLFAEGIESESQIQLLDELGVSAGQGFYLGEPKKISFKQQ
jgi:RNase E specificity factor CsrD